MKMRLLVDGDGTGDDRRLNMMLKALIKWCNAEEDQQTCEVRLPMMMKMMITLSAVFIVDISENVDPASKY